MIARDRHACRVALVGRRLADNDNLGLAYLRASLREAGFAVDTHVLNEAADLPGVGRALLARPPAVVGLSIPDGGSAYLPLALGELLHARGCRSHVTAGGPFATLARRWLLERYAWLGSVVRFAGEVPLRDLAERIAAGLPVDGVPGVTTRSGDGPPAPVTNDAPLRLRPHREELPRMLDRRAAHVAATRGCRGRCLYCGPASLQAQERAEGRRAGFSADVLDRCGVGGVRRREVDDLCDEMAELWRERDVRYFYFVDEHLLPYDEPGALDYLERWRRGLARRRVGPFGVGCMLRADRLTPAIAEAFARLGLVRAFLGLEVATGDEGRRFGRPAPGPRELALVALLGRLGVVTVSNLMLVHPYADAGTIAAGIDLLERIPAGTFEPTRMQVYHGTRLHERMAAEGRLLGNPLRWGYRIDDPVVDRFARIFSRLRGEALRDYSVGYRTHDAHLAFALRRRLEGTAPDGLGRRLEDVRVAVNRLYVDAYREALAIAREEGSDAAADLLVARTAARARMLVEELERLERRVLESAPRGRILAPMRAAAAGALSFVLVAGSAACCRPARPTTEAPARTEAPAASPEAGPAVEPAGSADASPAPGPADAADAAPQVPPSDPAARCAGEQVDRAHAGLAADLRRLDPCFNGSLWFDAQGRVMQADGDFLQIVGPDQGFDLCYESGGEEAMERRVMEALGDRSYPCLAGHSTGVNEGTGRDEMARLGQKVVARCAERGRSFRGGAIVLDENGRVSDVRAANDSEEAAEARRCVLAALGGLRFPCLAGMQVCPEWVIVE